MKMQLEQGIINYIWITTYQKSHTSCLFKDEQNLTVAMRVNSRLDELQGQKYGIENVSGCSFFDPIFYTTVYSIKHLNRCLSLISSFFKPLYRKHESNHPKTQIRLIPYSKAFNSPTLHTRYYLDSLRLACSASHNLSLFLLSFSIHLEP